MFLSGPCRHLPLPSALDSWVKEVENSMVGIPNTSIRKIALGHFLLRGRIITITPFASVRRETWNVCTEALGKGEKGVEEGKEQMSSWFPFSNLASVSQREYSGNLVLLLTSTRKKSLPNLICQAAKVLAANCSSKMWLLLKIPITLSPDSDLFCRLKESAINMGSLIRILTSLVLNSYNIFISFLKNSFQPALSLASGFCGVRSDRIWESLRFLIR